MTLIVDNSPSTQLHHVTLVSKIVSDLKDLMCLLLKNFRSLLSCT